MNCKNCGKEIDNGLEFCAECQTATAEKEDDAVNETVKTASESVDTPKEVWAKLTAKGTSAKEKNVYFLNLLKALAKKIIGNYKNFKNLNMKQKILHIAIPILIVLVLFGSGGSGGMSESEAMAYIATYNMLPSQMSTVYGEVSAAEVIGYMFRDAEYEFEKNGDLTYVTISGKCRPTYGSSDFSYDASITFSVNEENGNVRIKNSTNNCSKLMEAMAVQMVYN